MRYTVFLDRDGVINYDSSDYIKKSNEFYFIPESAEAVALLCKNNFDVIVITNQSVIGRKMGTLDDLEAIFAKMRKGVEVCGGEIKDIFFCPHTPDENCSCRKPEPGLIFQALAKYKIDPACSCMVGDSAKDIECANNAGCGCSLLVQTGNGKKAAAELEKKAIKPDFTGVNLMACAQWICENLKKPAWPEHGYSHRSQQTMQFYDYGRLNRLLYNRHGRSMVILIGHNKFRKSMITVAWTDFHINRHGRSMVILIGYNKFRKSMITVAWTDFHIKDDAVL